MKVKSVKAKGRALQNLLRDKLREMFITNWTKMPKLHEDDIKSQTMGMTGEDIVLSPAAKRIIPYSFECKNVEKLNVWGALEQCEGNSEDRVPLVVIKKNGKKPHVVMNLDHFLTLIGGQNELTQ